MLNLQTLKIEPFTEHLVSGYEATFGTLHPEYVDFLRLASSLTLENIANGDMLYHNVDHSIMVTMVGLGIIRGKHLYGRARESGGCPQLPLGFTLPRYPVTSKGPVSETMEITLK